jgi:uncharacterized membrane protein
MTETKKGKYDTNPLDPDVERQSAEGWGEGDGSAPTEWIGGAVTSEVASGNDEARRNAYSEAPTRRIEDPPLGAPYPSVFVPPPYAPPAQYQQHNRQTAYQAPPSTASIPSSRPVAGIGLPEKWALMLAYAPFYVGLIVSLLELFLVPRKEVTVRFHAAQSLALQIAILIVHTLFGVISTITDSSLGGTLFKLASTVFLIISMVRVWRGEPHRIAPLAEPAQWFNEHIEPRNRG